MSIKLLSDKEIKKLSRNPYTKSVTSRGITYTKEFKRLFITKDMSGMFPREIFVECGFDLEIVGKERIKSAAKRWRKAYKESGLDGLQDTRKNNSGRPSEDNLSIEQKYARLEAQNHLLQEEIKLLKKLQLMKREMEKKEEN